jgi:hypothetical protein
MGNTEQVKKPISSNKAEEISSPFEIFCSLNIEKITPMTSPKTPRTRFTKPNMVR